MIKYYRSQSNLTTPEGFCIEAGSLFRLSGDQLILVDDDFYFAVPFDAAHFEFAFTSEKV